MIQIDQVKEFHTAFNIPVFETPTFPSRDRLKMRMNILQEEVNELDMALSEEDITETLDAIVDCMYILIGTAHELGIASVLEKAFEEVHRSNMTKLDSEGKPFYREDGKVIKSEFYQSPNLSQYVLTK